MKQDNAGYSGASNITHLIKEQCYSWFGHVLSGHYVLISVCCIPSFHYGFEPLLLMIMSWYVLFSFKTT